MKVSTVRARKRLDLGENGQEVLYPLPYTHYAAVLAQAGTAAPTATILKNNLGVTPTLGRTGAGVYTVTATGKFTASKVLALLTVDGGATAVLARAERTSANVITIRTYTEAGVAADLVGNLNVEIRVYA